MHRRHAPLIVLAALAGACAADPAVDPAAGGEAPLAVAEAPSPFRYDLDVTGVAPGKRVILEVDGVGAGGVTVSFFVSPGRGHGPCSGNVCLEIRNPALLGTATTDARGYARLTVRVPDTIPEGRPAYFQASSVAGVRGTSRIELRTVGDVDGDGVLASLDCDDRDRTQHEDLDGDKVCEDVDPCYGAANTDEDGDGLCDDLDPCYGDERTGDEDGDGLCLDAETAAGTSDILVDTDGGSASDYVEVVTWGSNPLLASDDVLTVFVDDVTSKGNFGGAAGGITALAAADFRCFQAANRAGLARRTWKAFLSTNAVDAIDRIDEGYFQKVGGAMVATSLSQLMTGPLTSSINRTADGSAASGLVWTGSDADGMGTRPNCNDWRADDLPTTGQVGEVGLGGKNWYSRNAVGCQKPGAFLCFEVRDSDGDQLSDREEHALGTDPLLADTDGDGRTDHQEVYLDRTDPLTP